jgi:hypothetical protein
VTGAAVEAGVTGAAVGAGVSGNISDVSVSDVSVSDVSVSDESLLEELEELELELEELESWRVSVVGSSCRSAMPSKQIQNTLLNMVESLIYAH